MCDITTSALTENLFNPLAPRSAFDGLIYFPQVGF